MVELHFSTLFSFFATVKFVTLCGIMDDCSVGSVVTVVCSSVSDFGNFQKHVNLWKRHLLIMSKFILFCMS